MSTTSATKSARKTRSAGSECCTDSSSKFGLRNRYFFGKQLSPHSFQVEQRHMLERRRLLNRAIHGWGVVYGFAIKTTAPDAPRKTTTSLHIGPGLALDQSGRELLQAEELSIALDDLIVIDEKGRHIDLKTAVDAAKSLTPKSNNPDQGECWLLSAHYAEHDVGHVKINDACHCEHDEWDQTCETVRYSLQRITCDKCRCNLNCELDCKCEHGISGERTKDVESQNDRSKDAQSHGDRPEANMPLERGGCRCLCEHLTKPPVAQSDALCEIEESCGHRVRIDLRSGVPLACVDLVWDECDRWAFGREVEACGPRRLVKRNDLLFDLIRGCDLTRITEIGWKDWHRREPALTFDEFSTAFGPPGQDQPEYITDAFWVRFSRPVLRDSVRPDCFAMTIMMEEGEGGWWEPLRAPIVRLDFTGFEEANYVRGARLVVDGPWLEDGVRGTKTKFQKSITRVEIEVRGNFILDCNGQTIDADAVGLSPVPTGNGTPGGTFLSTFRVKHDNRNRQKESRHE